MLLNMPYRYKEQDVCDKHIPSREFLEDLNGHNVLRTESLIKSIKKSKLEIKKERKDIRKMKKDTEARNRLIKRKYKC